MRVTRRVNGNMTGGWIYRSELTPVAGTDALGGVAQRYVFGMSETGAPDYMMQAGAAVAFVKDALGSPRLVLNVGSGGVVQALTYDEYGQSIQDSSPGSQPFGFAGGLMDTASQLLRFGRRDYSPRWGRWTCVDPWLFHGGDTNCHAYCLGV